MKIEQGRDFTWSDDEHAPRVAIVSQNLAEELFPRGDAVGRHVTIEPGDPALGKQVEIIGIVNDATMWNLRRPASPELYVAALQTYIQWGDLLIRTNIDPRRLTKTVTQEVAAMGHEYIVQATPLSDHIEQSLLQERVTAMFSEFFGGLALLLVSVGLYGLLSYAVTRRTREIGIRVALGAQRRTVLWMMLGESIVLVLLGVVAGVPCALVGTRLIQNQLFGLSPRNPLTFAAVVLMLLAVGAVAGYIPARRATHVDPMVALRHE